MSKPFQPVLVPLRAAVFSAGGNDTIPLDGLPARLDNRVCHLSALLIEVQAVQTGAVSITPAEAQNIIGLLTLFDGQSNRFIGSLADLRAREYLENGFLADPDGVDVVTTTAFHVKRRLAFGPSRFDGSPTDFVMPVGAMGGASLQFNFGTLAAIDAGLTALAVTIKVTAELVLLDGEIRVPPAFEWSRFNISSVEPVIQGRALYTHLAAVKAAYAAIAPGDFTNFQINTGTGTGAVIDAATLDTCFAQHMRGNGIRNIRGEGRTATDVAARTVNSTTPTALAPAEATVQPIIFSPPDMRLSKLNYQADSALSVKWAGTNVTGNMLYGRILAQSPAAAAAIAAKALASLRLTQSKIKVKTSSKKEYNGPRGEYMPYSVEFAR